MMVSVVIPTYGRPNKVKEAIDGALRQTYNDIEIIIIDDNGRGTENQLSTQKIVQAINSNKIRYIVHDVNKGGCAARNTGILKANGTYIAFLDDDDIWLNEYIEKMIVFFTREKIGAIYCDHYIYDGKYSITSNINYHPSGNIRKNLLMGWCPVSTSLVMVRKSAIIECGLFDEKVKSFQDYDMWLTMSKNYEFAYCDRKMLLKYEGIGEQTSINPERRLAGFKYICEKWEKILNDEERELFKIFKNKYQISIVFKKIIYNKQSGKKYCNELFNFLKSNVPITKKIKLIKQIVIPSKLSKKIMFIRARWNKRIEIKEGRIKGF